MILLITTIYTCVIYVYTVTDTVHYAGAMADGQETRRRSASS